MKKKLKHVFMTSALLALGMFSYSCSSDDDEEGYVSGKDDVVNTNNASEVSATSAIVTATLNQSLITNNSVDYLGVSYGKDEDADDSKVTTKTIEGTTFTVTLTSLSAETTYYYKAFVRTDNGNYIYGSTRKFTTEAVGSVKSGKVIDLGLPSGTKWASCNVGASAPEDYGDYFAWGETTTKDSYTDDNSVTYGVSYSTLQSKGIIDSNGNLTAKYDAATANWGKDWHTPTQTQIRELFNNCEWTWSSKDGVNGYLVTGSNGNSIFLPAAGYRYGTSLHYAGSDGFYWSSTADEDLSDYAYRLYFFSGDDDWNYYGYRDYGQSVRPVSE